MAQSRSEWVAPSRVLHERCRIGQRLAGRSAGLRGGSADRALGGDTRTKQACDGTVTECGQTASSRSREIHDIYCYII